MKIENEDQVIAYSILGKLRPQAPSPPSTCIYRIPDPLKRLRKKDFVLSLVSIGPFHHGKKNLVESASPYGSLLKESFRVGGVMKTSFLKFQKHCTANIYLTLVESFQLNLNQTRTRRFVHFGCGSPRRQSFSESESNLLVQEVWKAYS